MNIPSSSDFTPPLPPIPAEEPGWYRFFVAARTNALQIWPRRAYEQDVLAVFGFGRKRFLFNAPKAIHRVLVENTANYAPRPPASASSAQRRGLATPAPDHRARARAARHADAGAPRGKSRAGDDCAPGARESVDLLATRPPLGLPRTAFCAAA